jgi:flagellar basal-body rod modification protein FlgD
VSTSSVNNVSASADTSTAAASARNVSSGLDKEDFLKLLVAQLKYQDPLNPTDSTEYVSQLAQFSTLEQMSNLNTTLSTIQALGMIGRDVTATVTGSSGTTSTLEGTVKAVTFNGGEAYLDINGTSVAMADITSCSE